MRPTSIPSIRLGRRDTSITRRLADHRNPCPQSLIVTGYPLRVATRACVQSVTAAKANYRTEVNNQNVVGEMSVPVLHCVLHFVQDRADFKGRPCLTQ